MRSTIPYGMGVLFLSGRGWPLFALVGKGRSAAAWWLMTMLAQLPLGALIYEDGRASRKVRAPSRRRPAGARSLSAPSWRVCMCHSVPAGGYRVDRDLGRRAIPDPRSAPFDPPLVSGYVPSRPVG